jgi:hypothetical protein
VEAVESDMHLSAEEALDLIEKRTSEAQEGFWNSHFSACSACATHFQKWQEMHSRLKRSHLENAPADVLRPAEALFQPKVSEKRSIREVIASVVFDSFAQPALAGARGASAGRQFLLRADQFDIHVRIHGASPERRLTGQILSRGEDAFVRDAQLHLFKGFERMGTTMADEFGEFYFREVPEGPLSLQIILPEMTVVGPLA